MTGTRRKKLGRFCSACGKFRKIISQYARRSPLSTAEFYALFAILRLQEAQDSAVHRRFGFSSLIETLNLSPQAVSKTLRLLEQKGYCKRITRPQQSP